MKKRHPKTFGSKISIYIKQRFGLPYEIGTETEGNETLINILSRRSHRQFLSDEVPEDLLNTLLATAFSAPSKSDLQQISVIHVADSAKKKAIADLSEATSWVADAPLFLVWCGDSRRIRMLSEWRGHQFANDHLDAFMNAAVDAGIAMQTFIIGAESVGLGCCPVSQIRDNVQPLSEILNLPKWVFPVAGLCVGWPADTAPLSLRLPLSTTVHKDSYDDSNLFEDVMSYDRRRELLEQTPPDQQRFVEKFGVAESYGWSENRTRQYAVPAREDFGHYIREQGFDLT